MEPVRETVESGVNGDETVAVPEPSPSAVSRAADLIARLPEHVGISEEFDVGLFHVIVPARNVPPELLPAASVPG